VILAGGLATRLGAIARHRPKSLVEVAGRPFLAWQLERIRDSGFREVLVLIGHLGDQIRDFAGDGTRFGLRIAYRDDGPAPLGTAGALRACTDALAPDFVVTYGDSYLPFDYSKPLLDLIEHPEAEGTLCVFKNDGRWNPSNTQVSGERVVSYQKGTNDPAFDHIDYGATALRRDVIARLAPGVASGLDGVQAALAARGELRAYRAATRFYEIGSPEGLAELDALLRMPGRSPGERK
jgi:N-acetyl-alpha-D-muramate 1-phosphate uridylyltransferase